MFVCAFISTISCCLSVFHLLNGRPPPFFRTTCRFVFQVGLVTPEEQQKELFGKGAEGAEEEEQAGEQQQTAQTAASKKQE